MASQNELQIILSLVDNASAQLKTALGGATGETNKLGDATKKVSDKTQSELSKMSSGVRSFRRELLIVGIAVAAASASVGEWANRNTQTRDSMRELTKGIKDIVGVIGSAFAPVVVGLAEVVKSSFGVISATFRQVHIAYAALIEGITYGIVFWKNIFKGIPAAMKEAQIASDEIAKKIKGTFEQNLPSMDEAKNKLADFNKAMSDANNLFLVGETSAKQYYDTLISKQSEEMMIREMASQQMQQLAQLEMEVGNTRLLEAERITSEQTNLLSFYKENYMQAHAGMAAATVALSKSIQTNLSGALSDMITGAKTAKEAFADFGKTMLKAIVDYIVQQGVAFALSLVFHAGEAAVAVKTGAAVAEAWADAAAAVSLATLGANAIPAATGMAAAWGLAHGLFGGGGGGANGTKPEGVMGAEGGAELVTRPTLFLAGEAGPEMVNFRPMKNSSQGGMGGGFGDIIINIFGADMSSSMGIEKTAEMLGFEIERNLRGARSMA